jgi:UDP-N-acetyl-D-galactosamine dehydrogenase
MKLAIIGLGYVGLPLAVEFAKKRFVIGYDLKKQRITELENGNDRTLEVSSKKLLNLKSLKLTSNQSDIADASYYIITVPTPVNKKNKPDLQMILRATKLVARYLKRGDIVIYESTVFPGCTEEICVPILEKISKLKYNKEFFCGYSPERVNPGDKKHTITKIKKIISGSTTKITQKINKLYLEIITAGTHVVSSIKVAEAAKVIENTQRDLNIAFMNELSIIFNKMNIETNEVLEAASTKWNFLNFKPGLVGGHCIGVDPYYLTYKSNQIGHKPKIILAGRKLNNKMPDYVFSKIKKYMHKKLIKINNAKILIMGLTFKENCTDLRNAGIKNIITKLKKNKCKLDLYDPWANKNEVKKIYNVFPTTKLKKKYYDAIIIALAHKEFKSFKKNYLLSLVKHKNIIFDLKNIFSNKLSDFRL